MLPLTNVSNFKNLRISKKKTVSTSNCEYIDWFVTLKLICQITAIVRK